MIEGKKIENSFDVSDLYGDQRELAELIGLETYLKLVEFLGGCTIYIAKADKIESIMRNRKIKDEFNGSNYQELALKYNLSERRVRDIIDEDRLPDNQMTIFDIVKD